MKTSTSTNRSTPVTLDRDLVDRRVSHTVPLLGLGFGNDFGHANETLFQRLAGLAPGALLRHRLAVRQHRGRATSTIRIRRTCCRGKAACTERRSRACSTTPACSGSTSRTASKASRRATTRLRATRSMSTPATRAIAASKASSTTTSSPHAIRRRRSICRCSPACSLLDAQFTSTHNPAVNRGNKPAFAPDYLARVGIAYREDRKLKLALSAVSVASQYWQDSNLALGDAGRRQLHPGEGAAVHGGGFLRRLVGAAAAAAARRRLQRHRSQVLQRVFWRWTGAGTGTERVRRRGVRVLTCERPLFVGAALAASFFFVRRRRARG